MRNVLRAAFRCSLFAVLGWASTASATSLVARVEKDRIIFAADTRRRAFTPSSGPLTNREFRDDQCKITELGKAGFASTGQIDYKRVTPSDPVGDWSASDDARSSYSLHSDNLVDLADDWGRRVMLHFTDFYLINPSRVKELAGSNKVLVVGVFAGWDDKGRPAMIRIDVSLDQAALSPIVGTRTIVYERDLPYTTNQHTKDLIEDNPELVSATAKKWSARAKAFPKSDLDWRWVEFLIRSTNAYDETVGKDADVLEIRASTTKWLHRAACISPRTAQKPVSRK